MNSGTAAATTSHHKPETLSENSVETPKEDSPMRLAGAYKGRTEGGRRADERINRDRVAAARQNDRPHEYMILPGAAGHRCTGRASRPV